MDVVRAPVVIGIAKDEPGIVGGPHEVRKRALNDVRQVFARREITHMHLETLRAIIVIGVSHQLAVRADDEGVELKVVLALGELVLIEDELLGTAGHGLPIVATILRALCEGGPVDPVAIFLRHAALILLDAAFDLFEELLHERLLRRHVGFEVAVLFLQVAEHLLVGDLGILRISQPMPRIIERDAVMGERVRTLFSDGGDGHGRRGRLRHDLRGQERKKTGRVFINKVCKSVVVSSQPFIAMLGDEGIIAEMRIRGADAINLRKLAGAERLVFIEAPDAFEQALAAEDFVEAGDAAGETVRGVEEGGIAVGDFVRESEHFRRNRFALALGEQFDGFLRPHGPVAEQSSDDTHRIG